MGGKVGCWGRQEKHPHGTPVQVHCRQGLEHCFFQLSILRAANAPTRLWQSADQPKSGHETDRLLPALPSVLSAGRQGSARFPGKPTGAASHLGSTKSGPFSYLPCIVPVQGHSSALYLLWHSPPFPFLLIPQHQFKGICCT